MTAAGEEVPDNRPKCAVCKLVIPKYRCPRCMTRTCSLPCVKRHKVETACSGVRDKSGYIHTKSIKDIDILNDYRFLEDVGRKVEAASRELPHTFHQEKKPRHLTALVNQVRKRGATLHLMPRKFSKRQKNQTKYIYKTNAVFWTIEWVFPLADAKHFDKHIDTDTLQTSLAKIFSSETDSVVRHKLRGYATHGLSDVTLLLKKEKCPANDQRYYELNPRRTINKTLQKKVIIEYPTIYVMYGDRAAEYPRVEGEKEESSSEEEEEEESSNGEEESEDAEGREKSMSEKKRGSEEKNMKKELDGKGSESDGEEGRSGNEAASVENDNVACKVIGKDDVDVVEMTRGLDITQEAKATSSVSLAGTGHLSASVRTDAEAKMTPKTAKEADTDGSSE